jgi:hypothetical protein
MPRTPRARTRSPHRDRIGGGRFVLDHPAHRLIFVDIAIICIVLGRGRREFSLATVNLGAVMKRKLAVASALLTLVAASASGKECAGIAFPEQVHFHGEPLTLNGLGVRKASIFNVRVYVAALYLTEPSSDPHRILQSNTPSELVLQFIRPVSAAELRKSWEEGFARNATGHPSGLEQGIAQLVGWVTNVRPGQRMTFIRIPGTGMQFDLDGTVKGIISSATNSPRRSCRSGSVTIRRRRH